MNTLRKLIDLLTPPEKKRALLLLILTLIMAFLEMLGVASILPFIAVLVNPQLIETNLFFSYLYEITSLFGVSNNKEFLFVLGITVFIFLMFSLGFRALTTYAQLRFCLMREYSIGKRLIEGYLHQPYSWFLNKNSSDFGKTILSEINYVLHESIIPIINLISQGAVVIMLLILLIIVDPLLAINVGLVLSISYGGIFLLMKNILSRSGSERLKANEERFTIVTEAFNSIKEIKFGSIEKIYVNRFKKPAESFAKNQSLAKIISQVPRYFIEAVAFGGMILLVLVLMIKSGSFEKIIPIIALYAFAGYRLMPALQVVYISATTLRFSYAGLNSLHKELTNLNTNKKEQDKTSVIKLIKAIKLNNVNFHYPNSKNLILKGINLTIPAYSKVGIVGSTGSGKTTMIDLILGLLDSQDGTLSVDDNIITSTNKRSWQKIIGYVPQEIYLSNASMAENIAFGIEVKNINQSSLERAAKIANLHDFIINELPQGYKTSIGERGVRLSGGQCQRIGIARALYHNPQVLILDEATSALDNLTEQAVMEAVNNLGSKFTIILIAHRLSTVKNCDKIVVLENGTLKAQGTYNELNQSDSTFMKMSGVIL